MLWPNQTCRHCEFRLDRCLSESRHPSVTEDCRNDNDLKVIGSARHIYSAPRRNYIQEMNDKLADIAHLEAEKKRKSEIRAARSRMAPLSEPKKAPLPNEHSVSTNTFTRGPNLNLSRHPFHTLVPPTNPRPPFHPHVPPTNPHPLFHTHVPPTNPHPPFHTHVPPTNPHVRIPHLYLQHAPLHF